MNFRHILSLSFLLSTFACIQATITEENPYYNVAQQIEAVHKEARTLVVFPLLLIFDLQENTPAIMQKLGAFQKEYQAMQGAVSMAQENKLELSDEELTKMAESVQRCLLECLHAMYDSLECNNQSIVPFIRHLQEQGIETLLTVDVPALDPTLMSIINKRVAQSNIEMSVKTCSDQTFNLSIVDKKSGNDPITIANHSNGMLYTLAVFAQQALEEYIREVKFDGQIIRLAKPESQENQPQA